MSDYKPLFAECGTCGERWKVATLPADCSVLCKQLKGLTCPNCGEATQLGICKTGGPHAVTESRDGKARQEYVTDATD